jgi:hypothetical protein
LRTDESQIALAITCSACNRAFPVVRTKDQWEQVLSTEELTIICPWCHPAHDETVVIDERKRAVIQNQL